MLTPRDYFWLSCYTLTDASRFSINATIRRVVDTDPVFLDRTEQTAFLFDRIYDIALILTQLCQDEFNPVLDHLHKKLNIVHCSQSMCDCVRFKNDAAFDDCVDRLVAINSKIQNGTVISSSQKKIKKFRRVL